jgi:hypothetical protein
MEILIKKMILNEPHVPDKVKGDSPKFGVPVAYYKIVQPTVKLWLSVYRRS